MPKRHNLTNRNGVWYYRRRVPQGLEKAIGRSIIQFSLKTKDLNEAVKAREIQDVEWSALFEQAEKQPFSELQAVSSLTRDEALRIVQDYVRESDLKFQRQEAKRGPISDEIKADIENENMFYKLAVADPSDEQGIIWTGNASDEILAKHNIELDLKDPFHDEFFEFVRRALLELYRRCEARQNQEFSQSCFDQLFASQKSNEIKHVSDVPLSKVCEEYVEEYDRYAEKRGVREKRKNDIRVGLDLIVEVIGADTLVNSVSRKMCREFVEVLSKMPTNRNKKFKNLPIDKVLLIAAKDDLLPMKKATQNSYLGTLKKVFDFAHNEGHIDRNPAQGLIPLAVSVPDEDKRAPFSIEHLQKIFSAPIFTGCVDDERGFNKPGPNIPKRSRYWLPLISLFTGMRMNEICQFNLDDLKCTDLGVHYFHVFPDTEDQRVKNESSRRKFPIHPFLKRLGLLDYIEGLRAEGETKAFPDLPVPKSGYRSDIFSKRFATFQKALGIPRKVGKPPNDCQ